MYIKWMSECVCVCVYGRAEKAREEDSWPTGSCTLLLSPDLHGISRIGVYFFFSSFFWFFFFNYLT